MRASGVLGQSVTLEAADHVCWVDDDPDAFTEAAVRFLTVGLARGERLLWIGNGAAERLRNSGGRLTGVDELTAGGALETTSIDAAYGSAPLAPLEQLRFYQDETRRALEDGYRGLRAVAEVTPLVADESTREAFLAWEHLCDRLVASGSGLSVLCAYRPADPSPGLSSEVLAEAASRHPVIHPAVGAAPFRVWFDEGSTVLSGELDTFGAERFLRLLAPRPQAAAEEEAPGGRVVRLDLTRLAFIDLAGVRAVAAWARRHGEPAGTVEIIGASPLFRRMWEILGPARRPTVAFAEEAR